MNDKKYKVLIFYKYTTLSNPQKLRERILDECSKLNIKGRIILADEGINGTVEVESDHCSQFIDFLHGEREFLDMRFKISGGDGNAFPKLSVKVRKEIVASHMNKAIDPRRRTGKYISCEQLHQWFLEKKEFYIVDMRNDYEYLSGYFEGSVFAGIHNFYELPIALPKLLHLKQKTIVTVCTSGVRCEKASAFLLSNGFENVYQLLDGIQTYMEKYPNTHFKGKLYVFDGRLTLAFNSADPEHMIVGRCMHCSKPCDTYINCAYNFCHFHYICCDNCKDRETGLAFCKPECKRIFLEKNSAQTSNDRIGW